jgi:hypothetical protein
MTTNEKAEFANRARKRKGTCGEENEGISSKTIERIRRGQKEKQQSQHSYIVGDAGPTFGQMT